MEGQHNSGLESVVCFITVLWKDKRETNNKQGIVSNGLRGRFQKFEK